MIDEGHICYDMHWFPKKQFPLTLKLSIKIVKEKSLSLKKIDYKLLEATEIISIQNNFYDLYERMI